MYPPREKGDNYTFPMYVQIDKKILCFMMSGKQSDFSDEPGVTRLFGSQVEGDTYMMYPIDRSRTRSFGAEVKTNSWNVIKFRVVEPPPELKDAEEPPIHGEWIFRRLDSGSWLLWKPYYDVYVKAVPEILERKPTGDSKQMVNKFEMFMPTVDGYDFSGTVAAAGTWTDKSGWTLVMGNEIIESMYTQLKAKLNQTIIDWDHDDNWVGTLVRVEMNQRYTKKYIDVEGVMPTVVPDGAGLSISISSEAIWDTKYNAWVIIKATVLGFSIITQGKPACTVCMIR